VDDGGGTEDGDSELTASDDDVIDEVTDAMIDEVCDDSPEGDTQSHGRLRAQKQQQQPVIDVFITTANDRIAVMNSLIIV